VISQLGTGKSLTFFYSVALVLVAVKAAVRAPASAAASEIASVVTAIVVATASAVVVVGPANARKGFAVGGLR
jgi:hypothetical protein